MTPKKEIKDLQDEMDTIDYRVVIIGDFNGRVGADKESNYPIGSYGKTRKNKNGQRIKDFKEIYQHTRVMYEIG